MFLSSDPAIDIRANTMSDDSFEIDLNDSFGSISDNEDSGQDTVQRGACDQEESLKPLSHYLPDPILPSNPHAHPEESIQQIDPSLRYFTSFHATSQDHSQDPERPQRENPSQEAPPYHEDKPAKSLHEFCQTHTQPGQTQVCKAGGSECGSHDGYSDESSLFGEDDDESETRNWQQSTNLNQYGTSNIVMNICNTHPTSNAVHNPISAQIGSLISSCRCVEDLSKCCCAPEQCRCHNCPEQYNGNSTEEVYPKIEIQNCPRNLVASVEECFNDDQEDIPMDIGETPITPTFSTKSQPWPSGALPGLGNLAHVADDETSKLSQDHALPEELAPLLDPLSRRAGEEDDTLRNSREAAKFEPRIDEHGVIQHSTAASTPSSIHPGFMTVTKSIDTHKRKLPQTPSSPLGPPPRLTPLENAREPISRPDTPRPFSPADPYPQADSYFSPSPHRHSRFDEQYSHNALNALETCLSKHSIRQSVEPDTRPPPWHRESTPAYEDRSPSPSPISRSEHQQEGDADMLDADGEDEPARSAREPSISLPQLHPPRSSIPDGLLKKKSFDPFYKASFQHSPQQQYPPRHQVPPTGLLSSPATRRPYTELYTGYSYPHSLDTTKLDETPTSTSSMEPMQLSANERWYHLDDTYFDRAHKPGISSRSILPSHPLYTQHQQHPLIHPALQEWPKPESHYAPMNSVPQYIPAPPPIPVSSPSLILKLAKTRRKSVNGNSAGAGTAMSTASTSTRSVTATTTITGGVQGSKIAKTKSRNVTQKVPAASKAKARKVTEKRVAEAVSRIERAEKAENQQARARPKPAKKKGSVGQQVYVDDGGDIGEVVQSDSETEHGTPRRSARIRDKILGTRNAPLEFGNGDIKEWNC